MNKVEWCTLFDKNYLAKGLCLIRSMGRHVPGSTLNVLALDVETVSALTHFWDNEDTRARVKVEITPLSVLLEDEGPLHKAQATRTPQEFAWTLASVWLDWCLRTWNAPMVYLDADSYFFSSAQPVFDEIGDTPIAVVPHRFDAEHRQAFIGNGEFNANFVYVKPLPVGLDFAAGWRDASLGWCFYRTEGENGCGDQRHLERMVRRHTGDVHIIQHVGCNLAPWNQRQYDYVALQDGTVLVGHERDRDTYQALVLYHFHELVSAESLTGWPLHPMVREFVYEPYIQEFNLVNNLVIADHRDWVEKAGRRA